MDIDGNIYVDRRVRVFGGGKLGGDVLLPDLPGVRPTTDPFFDRIGRVVNHHPGALLGAAAVGAGAGAVAGAITGTGVAGTVAGTVVGGIGGASTAFAGALALDALRSASSPVTRIHVRDVPGAQRTPGPVAAEQLRVMDWNIRELIGPDGSHRTSDAALHNVVATVRAAHPDVLVLEEVANADSTVGRYSRNQLDELARALHATDAVLLANGMHAGGREKGGALLTFGGTHIEDVRGLRHPDAPRQGFFARMNAKVREVLGHVVTMPGADQDPYRPRTTTDAMLRTAAGNAVRVLGIHLSGTASHNGGTPGSTLAQERQLAPLAATIDAWAGPTIMTGDFNVAGGSKVHRYEVATLGAHGLRDAFGDLGMQPGSAPTRSFPARMPVSAIDRMYVDPSFTVRAAAVLTKGPAAAGSDHLPILLDLQLGTTPGV